MQNNSLKRSVTLPQLVFYGLGTTVGAGVYALIGEIAGTAGYLTPAAFLLAALLALLTARSFAIWSAKYPRAAGMALYIQQGFRSERLGMVTGCLAILAGMVSSAALLNGFVGYANEFIGIDRIDIILVTSLVLCLIACWGIAESVWLSLAVTVIEIGGLIWVSMLCIDVALETPSNWPAHLTSSLHWGGLPMLFGGAVLAFYAYIGFEDMIEVAEEIKTVEQTLPRGIVITLFVSTSLYLLLVISAISAVGLEFLASSSAPLSHLVSSVSSANPAIMSAIGLCAIINGALIQIIMASRVLYGLAHRRQLPRVFARVNRSTRTPTIATLCVSAVICALALGGKLAVLAKLTSLIILLMFCAVNLSLWLMTRREGSKDWVALAGAVSCGGLVLQTIFGWLLGS